MDFPVKKGYDGTKWQAAPRAARGTAAEDRSIMKKLVNAVDRFCYRHPRFGIPNLMIYIVIGNVIVWLFSLMDTSGMLLSALMFSPYHILHGEVWRLVSFVLMPHTGGFLALIAFYFYYFIGSNIERQWGSGKFTI